MNNIKAVIKGRKVYDPNLDGTKTGGSGSSLVILLRIKELNLQGHKNVSKKLKTKFCCILLKRDSKIYRGGGDLVVRIINFLNLKKRQYEQFELHHVFFI